MAEPNSGVKGQSPSPGKDVHILWITAGLGCDGDSVSITVAMQPSVEDVLLGAIPGLPKVHLHNPVLAYENGDDFMKLFYQAEKGEIDPFVLVVEGSIPNETIKKEGCWAGLGTNPDTGQPILTCDWLANAWKKLSRLKTLRSGSRHDPCHLGCRRWKYFSRG